VARKKKDEALQRSKEERNSEVFVESDAGFKLVDYSDEPTNSSTKSNTSQTLPSKPNNPQTPFWKAPPPSVSNSNSNNNNASNSNEEVNRQNLKKELFAELGLGK
jgi:hypothetical protein